MNETDNIGVKTEAASVPSEGKKRRRPRVWLIVLLSLFAVFAAFALVVYFSFAGNPVTRIIATGAMRDHAESDYEGYTLDFAIYDFKCGDYVCHAENDDIPDSDFSIHWRDGDIYDDYKDRVTDKWNTYIRIESDLDDIVTAAVESEYPHKTRLAMATFDKGEYDPDCLSLGMEIDPSDPPLETSLVLWCETELDEPTWDELAADMLQARDLMEKKGFDIDFYSLSLEYPYNEEGDPVRYESLGVFDIPKDDITDDGTLAERLRVISEEYDATGK